MFPSDMQRDSQLMISINDLPNEILEYILCLLPPYKDLENCMVVCKRWHKIVQSMYIYSKSYVM